MSIEIARYQFHSWARKGIANSITEGDDLGAGTSGTVERAEVPVGVSLNGAALSKTFALVGPGDIIGINRDMVVRTEPLNWITDFEGNYLCFIEFYDEDFAWRYTPAVASGTRLRPWIFLLILEEDEFKRGARKVPLATISVKSKEAFPPVNETWLWAHVHSNADIPDNELSDYEKLLQSLNTTVNNDPDQLYCRLMSPRKLEPNTSYCAFLIPAFETGRLAGLEQPTAGVNAQSPSWDAGGARGEIPVYYEWSFRTGVNADFESLVRVLQPRAMDPQVGIRDMDSHQPGFVRASGIGELPATEPGLIGLEGALKAPTTVSTVYPNPPSATAFQDALQEVVNLPVEIIGKDDSGDPVISIPLYGGRHAQKSPTDLVRLDVTKDTWVNDLNRDPRTRVAAGFGTRVVQENQEYFMRKAWEQVTKVIEANRRIRHTLFYMKVAFQFTAKTFSALPANRLLAVSKPVLSRVMGSPTTVAQQIQDSRLPLALFSGAFRRLVRPKGKLASRLALAAPLSYEMLVSRVNAGAVTASPPRSTPGGLPNTLDIANQIFSARIPGWLLWLIRNNRAVLLAIIVLLLLAGLVTGAWVVLGGAALVAAAGAAAAGRANSNLTAAENLKDPKREPVGVAAIPPQPGFTLQLSDEAAPPPPTPATGGAESIEATNFRKALADLDKRLTISVEEKQLTALDLTNASRKVREAIHPYKSFPYRLSYMVRFPDYIPLGKPERIYEAMAYPDFDDAMYKKLVEISEELLLPNLKLIPQNTISLLKTNQKFIESYLVGLNHEMGSELLWREYPTDQRGSYFRQFWDVKGIIRPKDNVSEAALAEEHKDIKPIHTWPTASLLGRHNARSANGAGDQTVLVVRGDLLKRYPNTMVFAQKAIPGTNPEEPLIDTDLTNMEFQTQVKFPLYKADLPPDIKLFGFDLTIEQARGTQSTPGFTDSLGWFFVIQEVPGEPRFGMDIAYDPGSDGISWDDLAWDQLPPETRFISGSVLPTLSIADKNRWGADSAQMAYVLFQKPNLVAVHAREMLETLKDH